MARCSSPPTITWLARTGWFIIDAAPMACWPIEEVPAIAECSGMAVCAGIGDPVMNFPGIVAVIVVPRNTQEAKQTFRIVQNPIPALALYPAITKNIASPPSRPPTAAARSSLGSIWASGERAPAAAAEAVIGVLLYPVFIRMRLACRAALYEPRRPPGVFDCAPALCDSYMRVTGPLSGRLGAW